MIIDPSLSEEAAMYVVFSSLFDWLTWERQFICMVFDKNFDPKDGNIENIPRLDRILKLCGEMKYESSRKKWHSKCQTCVY